jgi:phosphate transport system permease protein
MSPGRARARRDRRPRRSARAAELLARSLIIAGGIGTISAVSLIFLFLLWVALPLFSGARGESLGTRPGPREPVLASGIDEYGLVAWELTADGMLVARELAGAVELERRELFGGARPSCASFDPIHGTLALGFPGGEVRLAGVGFTTRFLAEEAPELAGLPVGASAPLGTEVVERTPEGQLRAQALRVEVKPPLSIGAADVLLIDHAASAAGDVFCALTADQRLALQGVRASKNLLTGEETLKRRQGSLPYEPRPAPAPAPFFLGLLGGGDNVLLVWRDGHAERYDARDFASVERVEILDLVPEPGVELTALSFLAGKNTLVAGDAAGRVRAWFRIKPEDAATPDGTVLVAGHELELGAAPTACAPSARSRMLALGTAEGGVGLHTMTTERHLLELPGPARAPVEALALSPREDLLLVHAGGEARTWRLSVPHPEASLAGLFGKVWYEGYPEPAHAWQSSSGTDEFEPKLGLVPLVFGTIKATFYSMLFGAPLALLAAVFSSEFLQPRLRTAVKSTIEIMASLPSVVLGFLAALVIAPFVQGVLPAVLGLLVTVPLCWLLGAYLWQLLPARLAVRWAGWPRFAAITACLLPAVLCAPRLGAALERALFGGDVEGWLDGRHGSAAGGWMLVLAPACCLLAAWAAGRLTAPFVRRRSGRWSRALCAAFDLGRFLAVGGLAIAAALLLSQALSRAGFDPRGTYVDTYVQRNALVVGLVMGFAVIPIIYTIAEDALSSVPTHLRLASLGAGATPWQTAVRVIVPTAMSGLFSALMVGLGRAVGETMIVLMATGNTPVMEWNLFNGFRTLSANIAVELPEAVRNSTHYRTLFLAALCLFAMTFAVNTAAEVVRQRFRRRAFQL